MLTLHIEIEGCQSGDLEIALEEVLRLLQSGFTSGQNRNDTGRFTFELDGREEEPPGND